MFEGIRKHSKLVLILLFALIIPSFLLFGIENYIRGADNSAAVARVAGEEITRAEWDRAADAQAARYRSQMPTLDASIFDTPVMRFGALDQLVQQRVMQAAATSDRLVVSDAKLARTLHDNPAFAPLFKPDGTLDIEAYRDIVSSQGLTPAQFETGLRRDLSSQQVFSILGASSFAVPAEVAVNNGAMYQDRRIQVARFQPADYTAQVTVADDEVKAYYDGHAAQFQLPESAAIQYVVLDVAQLEKGVEPTDAQLHAYYDTNTASLAGPEVRRISHILIASPASDSASQREAARAKAQAILDELHKDPSQFAALAKRDSQDSGSAQQGGELGQVNRGETVKPFEDAAFALRAGQISDIVATEYGFHIIRADSVEGGEKPSFEQARPRLVELVRRQLAEQKYNEASTRFSDLLFQETDSLQNVADQLGMPLQSAQNVTRSPAAGAQGPLGSAAFLRALFTPEVLENKQNTEVVDLGNGMLAAGRVTTYLPPHTQKFEDAQARAKQLVVNEHALKLAREAGEKQLQAWKDNPASAELPAAITVSRDQAQCQMPEVVTAAMRTVEPVPTFTGVALGPLGYAVIKVDGVVSQADTPAELAKSREQNYERAWSNAIAFSYLDNLKKRFKTQITVDRPVTPTN